MPSICAICGKEIPCARSAIARAGSIPCLGLPSLAPSSALKLIGLYTIPDQLLLELRDTSENAEN
jgi:hypothetical protein